MHLKHRLLMLGFALLVGSLTATASELSVDQIIDRAVERAEKQHQTLAANHHELIERTVVRSLDADGEIVKRETSVSRVYAVEGARFEELIQVDGRPLNEKERRDERKKKEKFIQEVRERKAEGKHPQPEDEMAVRFNRELVERYDMTLGGEETVRGHRCWVIGFQPRSGELPVRRRIDRALNKSAGRFWISQDDYGLVRIEFAMREPYKYWGGLLATIHDTQATIEFQRLGEDVWLPEDFDMTFDIEVLMMKNIRRRITRQWSVDDDRVLRTLPFSAIRSTITTR